MKISHFAGFAPIVSDPSASLGFYRDILGLELSDGDYAATNDLDGVRHFGLWPLADAARSCFEATSWPADIPRPQACLEFEVPDVAEAAGELAEAGCRLLCGPKLEPWGQEVARLLSPEGLLVGVTRTPALPTGETG